MAQDGDELMHIAILGLGGDAEIGHRSRDVLQDQIVDRSRVLAFVVTVTAKVFVQFLIGIASYSLG
jgi:hypothetical protein